MATSFLDSSKNVTNNIANTGAQLYGEATNIASNTLSTSVNAVSNSVEYANDIGNKYLNNFSSVFYAIIGLLILCTIIGYGLYVLIIGNVLKQEKILVDGTEIPVICNKATEFKIKEKLADVKNENGQRRSISFWIYINDINKYAGESYRHIAHIGDSHAQIKNSSPYIFLDNITNKIYVRFSPNYPILPADSTMSRTTPVDNKKLNDVKTIQDLMQYTNVGGETLNCGFTIDYVPIQRWVHICVSMNDNKNGIVYIYVDAELVKVIENKATFKMNIADLKLSSEGNLFVGGDINDYISGVTGFSGLISKFSLYNYDMNQNDVYKEYNQGPFSGFLTKLGLGAYGLRNPIYKINTENN